MVHEPRLFALPEDLHGFVIADLAANAPLDQPLGELVEDEADLQRMLATLADQALRLPAVAIGNGNPGFFSLDDSSLIF